MSGITNYGNYSQFPNRQTTNTRGASGSSGAKDASSANSVFGSSGTSGASGASDASESLAEKLKAEREEAEQKINSLYNQWHNSQAYQNMQKAESEYWRIYNDAKKDGKIGKEEQKYLNEANDAYKKAADKLHGYASYQAWQQATADYKEQYGGSFYGG